MPMARLMTIITTSVSKAAAYKMKKRESAMKVKPTILFRDKVLPQM